MAGSLTVRSVNRPVIQVGGDSGEIGTIAPAAHLVVVIDRFSDGAVVRPITLHFSEYAGLEAEFAAGSATTVLDAAVEAEVVARDVDYGRLTHEQLAYIATTIAIAD